MILILHDLEDGVFKKSVFSKIENSIAINPEKILPCMGCFSCWTKLPGTCSLKDNYIHNSLFFKEAEKVMIISKCCYGSYSPNIKNFFDRSISYVKPQFRLLNGKMHHKKRYDKKLELEYYFYGDIKEYEKTTLEKLLKANALNLDCNIKVSVIDIGEYIYE